MFLFKRGKYYQLEYFDESLGKIRRISTGKVTRAEATKFVSEFKEKVKSNKIVVKISLLDFKNEYLQFSEQTFSKKYVKSIDLSFRMFEEYVDNPIISDIDNRQAEKFLLFIHRRAKYAAELYYRTLKASFNKAIQWGYLEVNPFNKIKLPKSVTRNPIYIDDDELNLILDSTDNQVMKDIFTTAFYTGLRLSELINLKWGSIDFKNNFILVKNTDEFITKNKKERIIPMHQIIIEIMNRLKLESKSKYIFTNKNHYKYNDDYISKKFKSSVRNSGLSEAIHFHSLRHSFASNLVRKGVSLYVVKEILGHEDISTTQIYAHLDNSALIDAVKLL